RREGGSGHQGLGSGPVPLREQPRGGDRKDALRPVLRQASLALARSPDPGRHGQDGAGRARGARRGAGSLGSARRVPEPLAARGEAPMKPALSDILVCPACQKALDLRVDVRKGLEILEGALRCPGCVRDYPIVAGVPRFVAHGAYATSFGRQWHWFRKVQMDSASGGDESERGLAATTGWTDADYRGKLVLDAGVGAGRFAEIAANKGADVVGVDLTRAVDAAYQNLGTRPNVHLLQADIFALPFRDGTFDLAYSVGVLHHTPNPALAFAHVAAVVRQGGALAIYVYARYGPSARFSDAWRVISTRLPLSVVRAI